MKSQKTDILSSVIGFSYNAEFQRKDKYMKKINWKIINLSLWTEVILSYLLPFRVTDGFQYQAGFPFPFISVYNTEPGITPLMSMHLNPFALLVNVIIIYFIISFCAKAYHKSRHSQTK